MEKKDFEKCEICGKEVEKLEFDSPLYCSACIEEMEKLEISPPRYKQLKELEETLGKGKK
ncbi:MAG: hypothetical protein GY861_07345 [bacterium]|nr:hypothetical protein [bacterium]